MLITTSCVSSIVIIVVDKLPRPLYIPANIPPVICWEIRYGAMTHMPRACNASLYVIMPELELEINKLYISVVD